MLRVRQPLEQRVGAHQVGAQDQLAVGLERVRAVGDAVEDRARLHLVEHAVDVERHERVELAHVARRQVLEPPGGRAARGRDDVGAVLEQRAREVGADEAAGPEHEDRALQRADAVAGPHAERRSGRGTRARGDRARCSPARRAERPWQFVQELGAARLAHRRAAHAGAHEARARGRSPRRPRPSASRRRRRRSATRSRPSSGTSASACDEVVRGRRAHARDDHDAGARRRSAPAAPGSRRRSTPCCRARRARRRRRRRARARGRTRSARRDPRSSGPMRASRR